MLKNTDNDFFRAPKLKVLKLNERSLKNDEDVILSLFTVKEKKKFALRKILSLSDKIIEINLFLFSEKILHYVILDDDNNILAYKALKKIIKIYKLKKITSNSFYDLFLNYLICYIRLDNNNNKFIKFLISNFPEFLFIKKMNFISLIKDKNIKNQIEKIKSLPKEVKTIKSDNSFYFLR